MKCSTPALHETGWRTQGKLSKIADGLLSTLPSHALLNIVESEAVASLPQRRLDTYQMRGRLGRLSEVL